MKKIILLVILYVCYLGNILAQGYHIRTSKTIGDKFLIASLPKTSSDNYQKLKIEILGGNFYNFTLGTKTYSISTRNGDTGSSDLVRISQEQSGGAVSHYIIKVYETALGFDFVLESTSYYMSVIVQAWLASGNANINSIIPQEIERYTNTSAVDVTNNTRLVQFINIYTTDSIGNIGLGVTTPKSKLDVNGTIRAKEVKIEAIGWADFVFGEDYKLPTLSQVEEHIKEHKHLPDIPSEKDVIEEGISIGDMQMKLLQKIEELTLYTIQLEKRINELENK